MQVRRPVGPCAIAIVLLFSSANAGAGRREQTTAAVSASSAGAAAPAPTRTENLREIGSANRWRTLIAGKAGVLPANERVVVADGAGRIIRSADGAEHGIEIPPDWMPLLRDPTAALVLAHNHPGGQSLSIDDLSQFEKRGVAVVIAVGHDGSLYAAAAGHSYEAARFAELYATASSEIQRLLRLHKPGSAGAVAMHRNHLVALALARAGVIAYRADLALDRRQAYNSYGLLFDDIIRGAAVKVRERCGPGDRKRDDGG